MTDLVERARALALAIDFSPDDLGGNIGTASLRNPDGKELLSIVEALSERIAAQDALALRVLEVLIRYRNETPLGHQPHMIALEADKAIAAMTASLTQEPQ